MFFISTATHSVWIKHENQRPWWLLILPNKYQSTSFSTIRFNWPPVQLTRHCATFVALSLVTDHPADNTDSVAPFQTSTILPRKPHPIPSRCRHRDKWKRSWNHDFQAGPKALPAISYGSDTRPLEEREKGARDSRVKPTTEERYNSNEVHLSLTFVLTSSPE